MTDKPFTKLLKCYVLNIIDELPASNREVMVQMEPLLQKTYDCEGSWEQIVAKQMDFTDDLPDQIRGLWEQNQALATKSGQVLLPNTFTEMFLRHNFPHFDKERQS
jgi:hypothetical protein